MTKPADRPFPSPMTMLAATSSLSLLSGNTANTKNPADNINTAGKAEAFRPHLSMISPLTGNSNVSTA